MNTQLLSICMICHRQIGPGSQPTGEALTPAENHSHGCCLACAPGYLNTCGVDPLVASQLLHSMQQLAAPIPPKCDDSCFEPPMCSDV